MKTPGRSPVATVRGADSLAIQKLFSAAADEWRALGRNVVGVIAEAHGLPDRPCTAGILRGIASEKSFPIYLETPPANTSCHLDESGVEAACAWLINQIAAGDLVILSKFGKLEAARRGLTPAFEAALAAGKPILTTVSDKHRAAWLTLAPDTTDLPADRTAIETWRCSLHL